MVVMVKVEMVPIPSIFSVFFPLYKSEMVVINLRLALIIGLGLINRNKGPF